MIHGEQRGSRSETRREMEGDRREPHGGGTETERDTEDEDRSHRNRKWTGSHMHTQREERDRDRETGRGDRGGETRQKERTRESETKSIRKLEVTGERGLRPRPRVGRKERGGQRCGKLRD